MEKKHCKVVITHRDGTEEVMDWATREITTEGGRVVFHRPDTGMIFIPPSDASVSIKIS